MEHSSLNASTAPSTTSVAIRYGLIVGIISVIYSLLLNITELSFTQKYLSWLSFIILVVGIYLAHNHFKRENTGFMTYGQGLGIGTMLSGIVGLLSGIFTYIYVKFIDNGFMERMQEMQVEELEKRGMSDEQIEQALKMSEAMTSPEMLVVWAIVGTLIFGFLLSLVIAAITKHTRPEFE